MRSFCSALAFICLLLTFGAQASTLDRVETVVVAASPAGGTHLNGILRLPVGAGPFAAVVLLPEHEAGTLAPSPADKQLLNSLADYLVSKGMVVLRLQERGNGSGEAQGTLAERSADALAALNYLRTRPQVDVTRLGLIGHGEGGNVALLASAQLLAPTFVVALAASGLPGRELLAAQPAMYGKVLGQDSTDAQRQRKYRLDQLAAEQEAAKMRAHGSNSAQVQTYVDQQRLRLKMAMRRDEEALVKHQRAMLEIVRQTSDNGQAQAILSNMLRQRYPNIAPQDVQASVQTLTMPTYRNYLAFDPLLTLPKVQCPVLLLQGDSDAEVNAPVNLALLKKGLRGNAHVTDVHVPGLNHALQLSQQEDPGASPAPISPDAQANIYAWIMNQK